MSEHIISRIAKKTRVDELERRLAELEAENTRLEDDNIKLDKEWAEAEQSRYLLEAAVQAFGCRLLDYTECRLTERMVSVLWEEYQDVLAVLKEEKS